MQLQKSMCYLNFLASSGVPHSFALLPILFWFFSNFLCVCDTLFISTLTAPPYICQPILVNKNYNSHMMQLESIYHIILLFLIGENKASFQCNQNLIFSSLHNLKKLTTEGGGVLYEYRGV